MKTADECVGYFGVDAERGLSQRQVEENRKKYGPNGELLSQCLIVGLKGCLSWLQPTFDQFGGLPYSDWGFKTFGKLFNIKNLRGS